MSENESSSSSPTTGLAKGRSSNNNPTGKNQYKNCPPSDDSRIPQLLRGYHRRGINDKKRLSELLFSEHNIKMSDSTVARRRRELGLKASRLMTKEVSDTVKRQLVLNQMAKDPAGKLGPRTVKMGIFQDSGIDLTREWIANEMRMLAPEAYASRGPAHNKGRVFPSGQASSSAAAHPTTTTSATTIPTNTLENARPNVAPPPAVAPPGFTSTRNVIHNAQARPPPTTRTCARARPVPPPDSSLASALDSPSGHASMDVDSDTAAEYRSSGNGNGNHDPHRVVNLAPHPHSPPQPHPHPAQLGISVLARDLGLPEAPRTPLPDDQTFGLVFDVLERATPTLATLKHFLTGVKPGNNRESEVVATFREQLRVLDGQLARMTAVVGER